MPDLFSPFTLGRYRLANRFVMAPLTRNRAGEGQVPTALMAEYYAQRAGAGLIVTEGVQPAAVGQGYPGTPGLHTDEQVAGWRRVAEAVHAQGSVVFAQLMHSGRIGHTSITGLQPVAPSPVRASGQVFTPTGLQDLQVPRELRTDELPGVVAAYVDAAQRAVAAGLDGVELHAANGYLLHQFLSDGTNARSDEYGGSPQRRARFVVEVATAVAEAIGADRVGIRVSPGGSFNDMHETEVEATYTALLDGIAPLGLAYLHLLAEGDHEVPRRLAARWQGVLIWNNGTDRTSTLDDARQVVEGGVADLVSFGRPFLANPDLVERLRLGAPLNDPDPASFYGGDARGYTDYPTLPAAAAA